jgi:hypothetical protein
MRTSTRNPAHVFLSGDEPQGKMSAMRAAGRAITHATGNDLTLKIT